MTHCKKPIKRGVMIETTPCALRKKHKGGCSPNLTGLKFGELKVLGKAESYVKSDGQRILRWRVRDLQNQIRLVYGTELTSGKSSGKHALKGCGYTYADKKNRPEYTTVCNHYRYIFTFGIRCHDNYVGLPYCDDWNPKKGGSFPKGAKWIIENLGYKPGPDWSIDIIEHNKGFVPGNLRWALRKQQLRNQQHKKLGLFTDKEFAAEAFRRGYIKADQWTPKKKSQSNELITENLPIPLFTDAESAPNIFN